MGSRAQVQQWTGDGDWGADSEDDLEEVSLAQQEPSGGSDSAPPEPASQPADDSGPPDAAAAGEPPAADGVGSEAEEVAAVTYKSRVMQQLTASEEDDLVYARSTADVVAAAQVGRGVGGQLGARGGLNSSSSSTCECR